MERQSEGETDRQDRLIDRHTDRQANKETKRLREGEAKRDIK